MAGVDLPSDDAESAPWDAATAAAPPATTPPATAPAANGAARPPKLVGGGVALPLPECANEGPKS